MLSCRNVVGPGPLGCLHGLNEFSSSRDHIVSAANKTQAGGGGVACEQAFRGIGPAESTPVLHWRMEDVTVYVLQNGAFVCTGELKGILQGESFSKAAIADW